jgi:CheY-like chemotaxis protein
VVDDDPLCGRTMESLLASTLGVAVCYFASTESMQRALLAAAATPPELVVVDYTLGDTTGDVVALWLRAALGYRGPIVCCSGMASSLGRPIVQQFDACLDKPITASDVRLVLARLLERERRRRRREQQPRA